MRGLSFGITALLFTMLLSAATLEQLGLDEMAGKSTAIVRARVTGSYTAASGPIIYTHYRVEVTEHWKGPEAGQLDVVVPGGSVGRERQSFSGAPKLASGREYILFLWTGRSGLTHIIGLSQGIFDVETTEAGEPQVARAATGELMLDSAGEPVRDKALRMRMSELRSRVKRAAGEGVLR